jgi:restriction system protein
MKLPNEANIQLPLLKVLDEAGGSLSLHDTLIKVKKKYTELTDEAKASLTSTQENRLNNRIAWARQQLVDIGELDGTQRGIWKITENGRSRLTREWGSWQPKYLEVRPRQAIAAMVTTIATQQVSNPNEALELARNEIIENVKKKLLEQLVNVEASEFEKIVAQLLEKLGYGSIEEGTIEVTGRSHDGGIDGVCSLDKLSLGKALFQAKKWQNNVGIEIVTRLAGSLHTRRAAYGILITTSDFTNDARTEANRAGNVKLINGNELAKLMIDTELGARLKQLSIPEVDEDYFNSDIS